jgi:hypothetical protein
MRLIRHGKPTLMAVMAVMAVYRWQAPRHIVPLELRESAPRVYKKVDVEGLIIHVTFGFQ